MSLKGKNVDFEIERIKLERLRIYGKIVTVLITVLFGTLGVALINSSIQKRQLEQQRLQNEAQFRLQEKKAEADRRQAEMKYLGDYLIYALENDIYKRLRFAEYFSALTISHDLQEKWKTYHDTLKSSLIEVKRREVELADAESRGDAELIASLKKDLELLRIQLQNLPVSIHSVEIVPQFRDIVVGETRKLQVIVKDRLGNIIPGGRVDWGSSNTEIAEISEDGVLKAKNPGLVKIKAKTEGIKGGQQYVMGIMIHVIPRE